MLILYTDGIPDAQNTQGEFFKERRLIEIILDKFEASAQEIQANILDEVQEFTGEAAQFDDITLLVIARYSELETNLSVKLS